MKFLFGVLALGVFVALGEGYVQVISTTCVKEDYNTGQDIWLTCPYEATGVAFSVEEFKDNLKYKDEDQKFCCGDKKLRYCCSLEARIRESPAFNPEVEDNSDPHIVYHYYQDWYHFGWFTYLIIFATTVAFLALIAYIFGCVIAEILELVFCFFCYCCGKKKTQRSRKEGKMYRPEAFAQNERSSLVVVPMPPSGNSIPRSSSAPLPPPPNYQAVTDEFGGTPDLYQNITSNVNRPNVNLPSYEEAQRLNLQTQSSKDLYARL